MKYRVVGADVACNEIENGDTIGFSGFTPVGYPKVVPLKLTERESIKINVYPGASVGEEIDTALAGMMELRVPYMTNKALRDAINKGGVRFIDTRIGKTFVSTHDKEVFVVETKANDSSRILAPPTEEHRRIVGRLISFFHGEVSSGRLPKKLLPLQSGVGNIANAVAEGLKSSGFERLVFYTEVLQDCIMELLIDGTANFVSATSISLSPQKLERFYGEIDEMRERLVLRPQDISNCPGIIQGLVL